MNTKIGLYFQVEIGDPIASLSLINLALQRLEQLGKRNVPVEYFELRLNGTGPNKHAYVKMDGGGKTCTDSGTSSRWDDAFLNAFDKVRDQLQYPAAKPAMAV
jgi:hypothetical protein